MVAEKNATVAQQVTFWAAGAPSYRWMDLIINRAQSGQPITAFAHRVYTYVALAMYDATVAAWESKYAYNRARPSVQDPTLPTQAADTAQSVVPFRVYGDCRGGGGVLSYLFPSEAATFQAMAEEAGKSRLYAGVEFPTDYFAGLELGRRVAAKVIERASADGSDAVWTGTVPTGKCMWIGTNPGNVTATGWRPFLLISGE